MGLARRRNVPIPAHMLSRRSPVLLLALVCLLTPVLRGGPALDYYLPAGATYDPKNGELKWTPDFSAGSDPQDPTVQSRTYKVTGKVRSDLDPVTSNDFGFLIVVKNVPREFRFNVISGQVFHLKEGVAYKQTLKLVNADFPNGGFRVSSKNLPLGATLAVDPVTPTDITLSFTPPVGFTQLRKNGAAYAPRCQLTNLYCETVEVELAATDPAGEMTVTKIKWEIEDVRQSPQLVAPDNVADDLDVSRELKSDLDLGAMANFGHVRLGLTVKNVTEPTFGKGAQAVTLERQARVGLAVLSVPNGALQGWTVAADADLTTTGTVHGNVRHVAAGVEGWLARGRVGVRAGVSGNTVDDLRPAASAGVSLAVTKAVHVNASRTQGRDQSVQGWSTSVSVAF